MANLYLAIIGDLGKSRQFEDRGRLQSLMREAIEGAASHPSVRDAVAASPEITRGDEFQILLRRRSGVAAVSFITRLTERLPVPVSFGLGLGALSMELGGPVRELDGPCFHRARSAVELAKKKDRWAVLIGLPTGIQEGTNALLRLSGDIRRNWTARQKKVIERMTYHSRQKDLADELDVVPSVVSEVLSAARYDAVQQADEAVTLLIDWDPQDEEAPMEFSG